MKRYQITIKGSNVQRCGFRNIASQMASELELVGLAEYLNKDVFIDVEGTLERVSLFVEWCKKGPEGCMIEGMELLELPVEGRNRFIVVHGVIIQNALFSSQGFFN